MESSQSPQYPKISKDEFRRLQIQRFDEWLRITQNWVFGNSEVASRIGPYLILVHSSEGNPERYILSRMENVQTYGAFPVQGGGSAVGFYQGVEIWVLHQYMGCTATQMWMECLMGTNVKCLIGLADMTAYLDSVNIGEIVLPRSALRGDLVTDFHAGPEIHATADPELLAMLERKLHPSKWSVHVGQVYSGMPGGVGVHNSLLREKIWQHIQEGIIGNAIETSVTYLEAGRQGIRAAEAWVVSDDLAYGTIEQVPNGLEHWEKAWNLMAQAALDVIYSIAMEGKGS